MEQKKKDIVHQPELFDINGEATIRPFSTCNGVPAAKEGRDLQIAMAGKQKRALVCNYETLNNLQKPPCTKVRTVV